jgi:uncharacterized SAM-binding protein YcdF (DUF218 family)
MPSRFLGAASASILRGIAESWVVSDQLGQADAIVVLGGSLDVRPAAAAQLYRRGISHRVIVARAETDGGRHARLNRQALIRYGVPAAAISDFGFKQLSTYGEARGVLDWAKVTRTNSVIIPIESFSTRRVRWIFNRALGPTGIRTIVQALSPPGHIVDDWWRHAAGIRNFRNELIKFAYYRLKY